MHIDIRVPLGLMVGIVGLLLVVFGLWGDGAIYERSLGINVNLWWGMTMSAFGGVILWLARRSSSARRRRPQVPEPSDQAG